MNFTLPISSTFCLHKKDCYIDMYAHFQDIMAKIYPSSQF